MSEVMSPERIDKIHASRNQEVAEILLRGYPDNPALYHWRGHGGEVGERSLSYRSILMDAGYEVASETETFLAGVGHDTLKFEYDNSPLLQKQFPSAEAYASFVTQSTMLLFEYDPAVSERTGKMILPTQPGKAASTIPEIGLVFADVAPVMDEDRTQMKLDTAKLKLEYPMCSRSKREISEIGFKTLSLGVLSTIYFKNLGSRQISQIEFFNKRRDQMRQNLLDTAGEIAEEAGQEIKELVSDIAPPFLGSALKLLGIKKDEIQTD